MDEYSVQRNQARFPSSMQNTLREEASPIGDGESPAPVILPRTRNGVSNQRNEASMEIQESVSYSDDDEDYSTDSSAEPDLAFPGPTSRATIIQACAEAVEKEKNQDAEMLRNLLHQNRQTALSLRGRCVARILSIRPDEDRKMPPSGPSTKNATEVAPKKEYNSQDDEPVKITKFGSKEPVASRHSIWVPIRRSFWTHDKKELQFLPSLDGNQNLVDVLAGFDMRRHNRMMKYGPLASQAKVDTLIDKILLRLNGEASVAGYPRGCGYPHLVGEQIGQRSGRVGERYNAMIPPDPKTPPPLPKPTNSSLRDLWCSRCCIYDCHRHGLPQAAEPRVEKTRLGLMLENERAGKWGTNKVTFPVLGESTLSPSLSDGQTKMFEQVFQMFQGNTAQISRFLHVTVAAVEEYATSNNIVMPPELLQPVDFQIDPKSKATDYYSIHNYNETWYSAYGEASDRSEHIPCYHEHMCNETNCPCVQNNHFCIRACVWGRSENRNFFRGCGCKGRCVQHSCSCYAAARECDPNLCSCNCCTNPAGQTLPRGQTRNDNILMERSPVLGIRESTAKGAGYGCFTLAALRAGDYVGEYVGELISHDEAERRGAIADANRRSYLFNLTPDVSIDASKYGNETRFINDNPRAPNVEPKLLAVQGEQRIAFFAKQDIGEGEELFFDYRYGKSLESTSDREIKEKFPWLKDQKRPTKKRKRKHH